MKVESKIKVGQLVKIISQRVSHPNDLYLVINKIGPNCELVPVKEGFNPVARRFWTESSLSVYA